MSHFTYNGKVSKSRILCVQIIIKDQLINMWPLLYYQYSLYVDTELSKNMTYYRVLSYTFYTRKKMITSPKMEALTRSTTTRAYTSYLPHINLCTPLRNSLTSRQISYTESATDSSCPLSILPSVSCRTRSDK